MLRRCGLARVPRENRLAVGTFNLALVLDGAGAQLPLLANSSVMIGTLWLLDMTALSTSTGDARSY